MEKYDTEELIDEAVKHYSCGLAYSIKRILANKPVAEFVLGVAADWGPEMYGDDDTEGRAYQVYSFDSVGPSVDIYLGPDDNVSDIKPVIAAFAGNPDFKRTQDLAVNEYRQLQTKYKHEESGSVVTLTVELSRSSHCTVETEETPTGEMIEAHERIDYRKVVVCRDDEGIVISRNNGGSDADTGDATDSKSDSPSPGA